ncbi:tRNA dihydrouridine synthase [Stenoxybacter acetivorans]|uniref:tRNA dihydrouridine synthase n=1 Tax=Stenoxybacter acetivorans TaxID=422441 RepID=UPI00068AA3E7|nr:tRNA-dihydrouridine synthase [Stenoxybacter acetivorans]
MHGLADDVIRDVLTRIGGFNACVTEFVRITHTIHSHTVWQKYMPELYTRNHTVAGTAVYLQLLGSDADMVAENALNAVAFGADKIDLNFGCPAPTVNKHAGGAALLRYPKQIEHIVHTVRNRLPESIILSAKMRLGYDNTDLALDCAHAIELGGAQMLTVHARTKQQAYQPPADWLWIARIAEAVQIPVIANGDVFTLNDYIEVKKISGCKSVMIGRGVIMQPGLARQCAAYEAGKVIEPMAWTEVLDWLKLFLDLCCTKTDKPRYAAARLKQWLGMLKLNYSEAALLFEQLRCLTDVEKIESVLIQSD